MQDARLNFISKISTLKYKQKLLIGKQNIRKFLWRIPLEYRPVRINMQSYLQEHNVMWPQNIPTYGT